MTNSEYVAELKEGVGAWVAWGEVNPRIVPDLQEAKFRKISIYRDLWI